MDNKEAQAKYYSNGKVMLCSTILLFLMVIIIVFLHTCRHSCFRRRRHHHRHVIRTDSSVVEGLRPSVLKFLHTFTYSSATHGAIHDCAVCLSEFADGEEGRVLPNCNHAFHSHCIDAWFRSHSNCPLCRTTVHPLAEPVQPPRTASFHAEPDPVSFSYFPEPVRCPRKPLELVGIIVDLESGHGPRISQVDN